jgi:hypothetical protein
MNVIRTIREALFEAEKTPPKPISKVIHNYTFAGETPEDVTFEQLIYYHDRTPQISVGVSAYGELITGTDMQINTDDEEAKKLIEDWIRRNNFYHKFESLVTTFLICGNAILEKLDEKTLMDVSEVDMSSIISKKRDEFGKLLYYEQKTFGGTVARLGENNLKKFIEFNLSPYSRKAWSPSLFHSISVPRKVNDRAILPLVEVLWAIEDAMGSIIMNNAYPLRFFTYEGANEQDLEKESKRLGKIKPGDTIFQTRKPEVEIIESQPNSKYTDYINHIEKAVQLGIKFPHDILTGDFTSRASSDTTEDIVLKIARGIKKYFADKLKHELFDEILRINGKDPDKVNLTVSFTSQDLVKLSIDNMISLEDKKDITKNELREWLKEKTGIDLFEDDKIEQDQELLKQNNPDTTTSQQKPELEEKICVSCNEGQHSFCEGGGCKCK